MTKTRSGWRWLRRGLLAVLGLVVIGALALALFLRGSLPQLDGEVRAAGLRGAVTVQRDAEGVPTIRGEDRADVAWATGYVQAQDRFFQMDLLRRAAAGELAALVGAAALPLDREARVHRFRHRSQAALATLPEPDLAQLRRYAAGVNTGLAALGARPFEYGLLNRRPEPWQPDDTLLVIWAMYLDLQGSLLPREASRGWLREHLSAEQLAFLLPETSRWDAPLDADALPLAPAPIPATAPAGFGGPAGKAPRLAAIEAQRGIGSNNWALAGTRTADGVAIVADDMHLGLRLPNIWYRADLQFSDAEGRAHRVVGVTLPGAPLVIVGDNGAVAWGFTNSYGDYLDLVDTGPDTPDAPPPRAAGQPLAVETVTEHLAVRGGKGEDLRIEDTPLGPLRRLGGHRYLEHWLAYAPGAADVGFTQLETAPSLEAALDAANAAGIPTQNFIVGDRQGRIAWTVAGPLSNVDAGIERTFPLGPEAPLWNARRAAAAAPRLVDPPSGQLWTANNRQLAGGEYRRIGDGGPDLGARARQIRDDLSVLKSATVDDVYRVVLDDRALFLAPWRERVLALLDDVAVAAHPLRAEIRRVLTENWSGHAAVDSVAYRLARGFMTGLYDDCFGGLDAVMALGPRGGYAAASPRWSEVLGRLVDASPEGWRCGGKTVREAALATLDRIGTELTAGGAPLAQATWGQRNRAAIAHPFAKLLPVLSAWLSAPADELAGDSNMPRVAAPGFGPSERMVMVPGAPERSRFAMPGGQSGHPLSPYFLAGHARWARGETGPLLPGPPQHTLNLLPAP